MTILTSGSHSVNTRNLPSLIDGRKNPKEAQIALKNRALILIQTFFYSAHQIALLLGVCIRTGYRWHKLLKQQKYEENEETFTQKTKSKLNRSHLEWLKTQITETLPIDHKFETTLWTRAQACTLIEREFHIKPSIRSMSRYFKLMKISYQKPIRKAYQQCPIKVDYYCEKQFPNILMDAWKNDKEINWLDESTLSSHPHNGKTWGGVGHTPIIPNDGYGPRINVIGTLSLKGDSQYMTYEGNTNEDVLITFFINFLKHKKQKKQVIILDNARYHKGSKVIEFINEKAENKLELIYQPTYSPELNPIELVWAHLKKHFLNKIFVKTKLEFSQAVERILKLFSNNPACGLKLFGKKELKYIFSAQDKVKKEMGLIL